MEMDGGDRRNIGERCWGIFLKEGSAWIVGGRRGIMNINSYNIRGLGGVAKKKEIRDLIQKKSPEVLCEGLSGSSDVCYSFKPSIGRFSGSLTLWALNCVEMFSSVMILHALVPKRLWKLFGVAGECG